MTHITTQNGFSRFDATLVISLAAFGERRKNVINQLKAAAVDNYRIVDAVDGKTLNLEEMQSAGVLRKDHRTGRLLNPGEVGCLMSHRRIWQLMLDERLTQIVVLEDDVVLRDDAASHLATVMDEVMEDWDIIHLHSTIPVGCLTGIDKGRSRVSDHIWKGHTESGGTVAYALSNRNGAADYLLELSHPMRYAADGNVNWLTSDWGEKTWHGFVIHPFLCDHAEGESAIWQRDVHSLKSRFKRMCLNLKHRLLPGESSGKTEHE
jgi:GR25 family glycosyltransferase involved in LPS biosynthesis